MTTNKELITKLREQTGAPMAFCISALKETGNDFDKAVDLIKIKNLQTTSSNEAKVASEGVVVIAVSPDNKKGVITEINAQTDFTARSPAFTTFAEAVGKALGTTDQLAQFTGDLTPFNTTIEGKEINLETMRQDVMAITKENVVVRRWFCQDVFGDNNRVFSYLHSNNKLGVVVAMSAPNKEALDNAEFIEFGNNVAMQIAGMAPIAVSEDQIPAEVAARQTAIFQTQVKESGKKEQQWAAIIQGKLKKWVSEVSLMNQESVITPKTSIQTLADNLSKKLCGESGKVSVIAFSRAMVGEGIEKPQTEDYALEIAKMTGLEAETTTLTQTQSKGNGSQPINKDPISTLN